MFDHLKKNVQETNVLDKLLNVLFDDLKQEHEEILLKKKKENDMLIGGSGQQSLLSKGSLVYLLSGVLFGMVTSLSLSIYLSSMTPK